MIAKTSPFRVFLVGEGPNELGSRAGHPSYQTDDRPGVLCALLLKVQSMGWKVGGSRVWSSIRKFRARGAFHSDTHNVLGAALDAKEAGCDVLAFSRDLDNDVVRREAVEDGIARIPSTFAGAPEVIGGVAIPTLEGWILALLEEKRTEELTPKQAEKALMDKRVARKDGSAMARIAEEADLGRLPADATSLAFWLNQARNVLPPAVAERARGSA